MVKSRVTKNSKSRSKSKANKKQRGGMNNTPVSVIEPTIQKQLLSYATRFAELTFKEQEEYIQLLQSTPFNELSVQQKSHLNMYLRRNQQQKILTFLEMLRLYSPQQYNFLNPKVSNFFNTIDSEYITGGQREEIKGILNATPKSTDIMSTIKKLLDFIGHMKDEEDLDSYFFNLRERGRKIYGIRVILETYVLENPTEYSTDYKAGYLDKMDIPVLMVPVVTKYFMSAIDNGYIDQLSNVLTQRIREAKNKIYFNVLKSVVESVAFELAERTSLSAGFESLFEQSVDIAVKKCLELVYARKKPQKLGGARKSKKQKRKSNNSKKRKSNKSKKNSRN